MNPTTAAPGQGRRSGGSRTAGSRSGGSRSGRRGRGFGEGAARRSSEARAGGHPEDPPGDPEAVARAICLKLLTMSPKTRSQLADALAAKGVPGAAAEAVLDRYTEVGLIDDAAYAQAWVITRQSGRGLARRALAQELHLKGIDKETAGLALATVDPAAEEGAARELVRRKLRSMQSLEPSVATRRLLGMLARKGYPAGLAFRVIRAELAGTDETNRHAILEGLMYRV